LDPSCFVPSTSRSLAGRGTRRRGHPGRAAGPHAAGAGPPPRGADPS
jgi:hypothetical protein